MVDWLFELAIRKAHYWICKKKQNLQLVPAVDIGMCKNNRILKIVNESNIHDKNSFNHN